MSAPTPAQILADAIRGHQALLAAEDERADGFQSEPDVEPDWNDPDEPGYGGVTDEDVVRARSRAGYGGDPFEPYHDGTTPYSRYESDDPNDA